MIDYGSKRVSKRKEESQRVDQEGLKKKNAIERFYLDRIINRVLPRYEIKEISYWSPNVSSNKEIR